MKKIIISEVHHFPDKNNLSSGEVRIFALCLENAERPFFLGANSHPSLGGHASWGSGFYFGLDNLNECEGPEWKDWRRALISVKCHWVISVIESAVVTGDLQSAVDEILKQYEEINAGKYI